MTEAEFRPEVDESNSRLVAPPGWIERAKRRDAVVLVRLWCPHKHAHGRGRGRAVGRVVQVDEGAVLILVGAVAPHRLWARPPADAMARDWVVGFWELREVAQRAADGPRLAIYQGWCQEHGNLGLPDFAAIDRATVEAARSTRLPRELKFNEYLPEPGS